VPVFIIHSLKDFAVIAGLSLRTVERLVAAGKGPKITRLSKRRVGITDEHAREWLKENEQA
jgi:hypothetical protein